MTITQIAAHPLDNLIGETLYCGFDLIHAINVKLENKQPLTPFQAVLWRDWQKQAKAFDEETPKEAIEQIHRMRSEEPAGVDITSPDILIIHCRKAVRLITVLKRVRGKMAAQTPISMEEFNLWKRFQYISLPAYPPPQPVDPAYRSTLIKLELRLRNAILHRIEWDKIRLVYKTD